MSGTLLNISQAAELMWVNPETLRRWDKSWKFTSIRHPANNYRVYLEEHVRSFIAELQLVAPHEFESERHVKTEVISPYYFNSNWKLYRTDAINFLRSLDDGSVDMIFADPPYNIKKASWDSFASHDEYINWSIEWIGEASRVLKNGWSLYVCGFSEILADIKCHTSKFFNGCKWLVWYYRNKGSLANDWGRSHESIVHFRKGKKAIFNVDEVRIPYNAHTMRYPERTQGETSHFWNWKKKSDTWMPHPLWAKPRDVFEIPTIANNSWERMSHPTQKPVALLKKFILASSNPNDVVLDPFSWSGTTLAVSEALGRRWLWVELEEGYCKIIVDRLSDKAHVERIFSGEDERSSNEHRRHLRGNVQ